MKSICIKIFILMFSIHAFSFSPSVVVQMAQHDLDRDSLRESTFILENGILDVLFDAGFIVSSLPTIINAQSEDTLKETIQLAKDGFMSYVVYVDVEYVTYGFSGDETISVGDIKNIDWNIVKTSDKSIYGKGMLDDIYKHEGETDFSAMERLSIDLGVEIKRIFDN